MTHVIMTWSGLSRDLLAYLSQYLSRLSDNNLNQHGLIDS